MADQLHFIIGNLTRYIKVAGTFGAVIEQNNGAGQGCSMSILAANLYVATLLNYLKANFLAAEVAAFLDDRNVVTRGVNDLLEILAAIKDFDDTAGHMTNVDKTAVFATAAKEREQLRRSRIHGQQLTVTLEEVMVGHCITTRRARRTTFLSGRMEKAAARAEKAATVGATRRQRVRLVQQAVVPMAVSGTLWDLPSGKSLDGLRTSTLNTIWGKHRKQRWREIVMAILHDPVKTDPLAAMVFRRFDDARQLMRKSRDWYFFARHLYEMTREDVQHGQVFQKGRSSMIKGLHQAAALIGGTLELTDRGFEVTFSGTQPPLLINSGSDASWRARLKSSITNAITRQLNARTVDPHRDLEGERRGKRKDLFGVGPAIDTYATMANLSGRAAAVIERCKRIWDDAGAPNDLSKYRDDEIDKQRLQAVMAGSLRAPDRLHKAGLAPSARCPFCGQEDADLQHMMWTCTAWAATRAPFIDLIRRYCDDIASKMNGPQRVEEIKRLIALPCLYNCGIVPGAEYFKTGGAPYSGAHSKVRGAQCRPS